MRDIITKALFGIIKILGMGSGFYIKCSIDVLL